MLLPEDGNNESRTRGILVKQHDSVSESALSVSLIEDKINYEHIVGYVEYEINNEGCLSFTLLIKLSSCYRLL